MTSAKFIVFSDTISPIQFAELIQKPNSIKWTSKKNEKVSMLDSFDGRMFRAGYSVKYENGKLFFKGLKNANKDYLIQAPSKELPLFPQDFKDENTRNFLHNILDVRALIKRLSLNLKIYFFCIINSDQKTIARGKFVICNSEQAAHGSEKVFCFITPLRGYTQEFNEASKNWPAFSTHSNFDTGILKTYNINLADYSKPRFLFNKEMFISGAFYSILKESFEIMRKNEQGIIDDIDIEFLHDYRVSGRRMRSALSLIKNVLAPEMNSVLINDLKEIGTISGPLRDLDVYLLREDEYKNSIPKGWSSKELHSIFVTLKSRRRRALKSMVVLLKSEKYHKIALRWQNFFENFKKYVENDKPLFATASTLILKRYKKVIKEGHELTEHSPDEGFHELRKTCKKLRYLIEFFSSLYPQDKITLAVNQLKVLQDNLGNFNDLSVQIETLDQFLSSAVKKNNTTLIQDISGLIAVLSFKKLQLRKEFHALFSIFSSPENELLFNDLFLQK